MAAPDAPLLAPLAACALLLLALALWGGCALRRKRRATREAAAAARAEPLSPPHSEPRDTYVSVAMTDSQRTASSFFTGSSRGLQAPPPPPQAAHDYSLARADADALYAALQTLSGRRLSFAKIAFDAVSRRRAASPARRVWLCQYEGDEMDVTQLVPAAAPPSSASAQASEAPTSPRGLRGLSSGSSSSSVALSPSAAAGLDADVLLPQLEQFVREIRLVATLRHAHVAVFVGVAWSALSTLSLVTEHLPHGDLRLLLRRHRRDTRFSWRPRKLRLALGVARALAYLHARRVAFRGLRASRVGLTSALEAQLVDFSAAAAGEGGAESAETLAAGGGDAFWLAPELLSGGGGGDGGGGEREQRADVYAFGVLLSELDSGGRAPFHRELRADRAGALRPFQVLHGVASGALRPALRPDCPPAVRALAASCTAQEARDRPLAAQVCERLAAALASAEGGGGGDGDGDHHQATATATATAGVEGGAGIMV